MAYPTQCQQAGKKCVRKPYFSSPDYVIDGKYPLGSKKSTKKGANAALRMRRTIKEVKNYR